jgi:hypothetical protein
MRLRQVEVRDNYQFLISEACKLRLSVFKILIFKFETFRFD